jgi:hypothetical protein
MANSRLAAFARGLQPIKVASRERCFVAADVSYIHSEAAKAIGSELRLAGRHISVEAAA